MKLLLDTCAVIDLVTAPDSLDKGFWDIYDDPENIPFASFETAKELVVSFNNNRFLSKYWKTAEEMLLCIERDYGIEFLPLRRDSAFVYSRLRLNLQQDHKDPSDHIIISHAIAEHLTLLSSDTRFWYYRDQGLELIEY